MVECPWRGAHPGGLLPAPLSRLLHLGGAGGSADSAVVHLREEETSARYSRWDRRSSKNTSRGREKRKDGEPLTLLTANVAMPSIAAPPTPNTSLALESMKSMAVPIPLSSFFPLRSPFTPAILPLNPEEIKRVRSTATGKGPGHRVKVRIKVYFLLCS